MLFDDVSVSLIKEVNTADCWWCSSAVMFSVKNGKNTICEKYGTDNDDYEHASLMLIDGKPMVQAILPDCPTCKGMLAAGYGIENVDCPELKEARECMNSKFVSITDSFEKMKPLLGLLDDGYYVLADTICLPSNGEGKFFYEVSSELRKYDSVCEEYYCNWNFGSIRHFPLFLYPTQSSALINNERVEYYAHLMKSGDQIPRVLAYHYTGFFNVLLDGHHKACAAASLGQYVRCLTIIPADGCKFAPDQELRGVDLRKINPFLRSVEFGDLETKAESGMRFLDICGYKMTTEESLPLQEFRLNESNIHYGPDRYPTIYDLMTLMNPDTKTDITLPWVNRAEIEVLLEENTDEADRCLAALINYLAVTEHDKAYRLAGDILKLGDDRMRHCRIRAALLFFLDNKSDETEQLMVDFYLSHKEQDENMNLVNSYWKK